MTSWVTITLDTAPPASPSLVINGGAAVTGSPAVALRLTTADYQAGARDVSQMKIWGDVDPGADPLVQTTESGSAWQTYAEDVAVMLAGGNGRKTIRARLRDDVCNETLVFTDFIDLDTTVPVVVVTTGLDHSRISKISPCDRATFSWQSSRVFDRYEVRVVPNIGSPAQSGMLIGTAHGSINTSGDGYFSDGADLITTITGSDLEAASPGDTDKIVKVFVRAGGRWSP